MALSSNLLEMLTCPKCKGPLSSHKEEEGAVCKACSLFFPMEGNKLHLTEEEALALHEGKILRSEKPKASWVYFSIQSGPQQGEVIQLANGHCKAIGRSLDDVNKTQIFSAEPTVPLDDFTKKLVLNYLAKKRSKTASSVSNIQESTSEGLGSFHRDSDLVLNDPAISRLHAMIFNDEGNAGVLDLVSRNGTYLNGQEIESKSLQEGDVIEVGSTQILFSLNKIN